MTERISKKGVFTMPKEKASARQQETGGAKKTDSSKDTVDIQKISTVPTPSETSTSKNRTGAKGNRSQIGGTAVPGAKSTLPKQTPTTNNPQQQEMESYNRTMRRRMQQMGTGAYVNEQKPVKTIQDRRKERVERIKERRRATVETTRKNLPGGKINTDTRRVYYLVAGIAIAIVALILIFVILRTTGVLH